MTKAKVISCVLLLSSIMTNAQLNRGIQWTSSLSWEQIKQKAKQENKYIFLDVFATWCGPCKEMDKRVYVNDSVGDFLNDQFLSVKVQTDQTSNDDELVKKWYDDAKFISKTYRVLGLPTHIFLSPDGTIVYKSTGYKNVQKFIEEAKIALQPGQTFIDPYSEYDQLEVKYHQGERDYTRMLYMIRSARELRREDFRKLLVQDFTRYLESASDLQLYTKENMEFLNETEIKSNDKLFRLFYPINKKADEAIGQKGFSKRMVNRVVLRELVQPFLQFEGHEAKPIRLDGRPVGPVDTSETDWDLLYKRIRTKYSKEYAIRGVLNGKLIWYEQKQNFPDYYAAYLEKLDRYGFDSISTTSNTSYSHVNLNCWFLFLRIEDKQLLSRAAKWMHELIKRTPSDPTHIDTYANLLYKAGYKEKAISWEEKALELALKSGYHRYIDQFTEVLSKMCKNERTW